MSIGPYDFYHMVNTIRDFSAATNVGRALQINSDGSLAYGSGAASVFGVLTNQPGIGAVAELQLSGVGYVRVNAACFPGDDLVCAASSSGIFSVTTTGGANAVAVQAIAAAGLVLAKIGYHRFS